MSLTPLLNELFAMTYHSGIKPGLERIEQLCKTLDNPHLRLPVVHVAGTNGKGSTCAMLASVLQQAGYNVGLYSSPHIHRFNERVRINGVEIPDADIDRLVRPLMAEAKSVAGTFFEVTTAMAFAYLAEQRVDVAIIETGLGGRLDATNIVQPLASIITSIDLDHTEYLGNTLQSIAREKAGIIKEGAPAVVGSLQSIGDPSVRNDVRQIFVDQAESVGTSIIFADDVVKVDVDSIRPDLTMSVSVIDGDFLRYYESDLPGSHQAQNIATVMAAIPLLRDVTFIDDQHVEKGLASTCRSTGLNGRTQLVQSSPTVVLDVSHNPAGITALRQTLTAAGFANDSWQRVFGAMQDKDILEMLSRLRPLCSTLHLCCPNIERAARVATLEQLAGQVGFRRINTHNSVADAVSLARRRGPTLICGSFHVADEALREFE